MDSEYQKDTFAKKGPETRMKDKFGVLRGRRQDDRELREASENLKTE